MFKPCSGSNEAVEITGK